MSVDMKSRPKVKKVRLRVNGPASPRKAPSTPPSVDLIGVFVRGGALRSAFARDSAVAAGVEDVRLLDFLFLRADALSLTDSVRNASSFT